MKKYILLTIGVVALFLGMLLIGGINPGTLLMQLLQNSFGSSYSISGTLKEATPLLICGVAVFLALKAGLFNIGVEGQFAMGALAAAGAGLAVPPALVIPAAIVAGMLVGALWSLPAGLIRAYRNGHEVITTIMLNMVAVHASNAIMSGPLKAKGATEPTTEEFAKGIGIPMLMEGPGVPKVSPALFLGIIACMVLWWWLRRTVKGFELQAVGANPKAAGFAGIDAKGVMWRAMVMSGAIAGLGGAIQVLAFEHRCYTGFSSGYGFDALGVALLAGTQPLGMIVSAGAFGALKQGFAALAATMGLPRSVSLFLLGLAIIILGAFRYRKLAQREVEA